MPREFRKWVIGGCVVIAVALVYLGCSRYHESRREAEKSERLRIQKEREAAIARFAAQFNAISDWPEQLPQVSPIMTFQLEKLWQVNNPILFLGRIKDISTVDADHYQLVLEGDYLFLTDLVLSVRAPKPTVDAFLRKHPELQTELGFLDQIAVVASVKRVTSSERRDRDGDAVESRIGHGELLGLFYANDSPRK